VRGVFTTSLTLYIKEEAATALKQILLDLPAANQSNIHELFTFLQKVLMYLRNYTITKLKLSLR
jgi:hypothetical protein